MKREFCATPFQIEILIKTTLGVQVYTKENQEDSSLIEIVSALKKSKVFIACLSDEYARNDRCRMEFQYAKKTLRLPVIPVVVSLLNDIGGV